MRLESTAALSLSPANSHVSRARCIGLQRTSSNAFLVSTGRIRSASRRPLSVNGTSVVPVCCPVRLHNVSPCLIANTSMVTSAVLDVVGLSGTDRCRACFLTPPPARDLWHVVAVSADVCLVVDQLVADRLFGVGGSRPELGYTVDDVTN